MEPKKYLNDIIEDIKVAILANKELKKLPKSTLKSLEGWYSDVDIIIPMNDMQLDKDTKVRLLSAALEEMLAEFNKEYNRVDQGGEVNKETHLTLANKVDPLWREIASLHAEVYNEEFEMSRPKDHNELTERIMVIEEITGMKKEEIKIRAEKDMRVRKMLCDLGLLPNDLN